MKDLKHLETSHELTIFRIYIQHTTQNDVRFRNIEITTNEELNVNDHELQKTIETLKNRETTSKYGIANTLLKYCVTIMTEQLTTLDNKVIKHNKILEKTIKTPKVLQR